MYHEGRKEVKMTKGRGQGGAKRHRNVLRAVRFSIQGITKHAIRRLARHGVVKRISGIVYLDIHKFELNLFSDLDSTSDVQLIRFPLSDVPDVAELLSKQITRRQGKFHSIRVFLLFYLDQLVK